MVRIALSVLFERFAGGETVDRSREKHDPEVFCDVPSMSSSESDAFEKPPSSSSSSSVKSSSKSSSSDSSSRTSQAASSTENWRFRLLAAIKQCPGKNTTTEANKQKPTGMSPLEHWEYRQNSLPFTQRMSGCCFDAFLFISTGQNTRLWVKEYSRIFHRRLQALLDMSGFRTLTVIQLPTNLRPAFSFFTMLSSYF